MNEVPQPMEALELTVALNSLPDFREAYATRLSEAMPERLQDLDRTNELQAHLREEEVRFMRLALDLKRRNPNLPDQVIEEIALQEVMPPEQDETTWPGTLISLHGKKAIEAILAKVRTWAD